MMLGWRLLIFVIHSLLLSLTVRGVHCNLFQTMFGLPSQCVHHNVIHSCKLSFSCWLQGGVHATGCGSNKWLFSCCVSENEIFSASDYGLRNKNAMQPPNLKFYKKNVLRRRTDDLNQVECGIAKTSENTIQKRIIGGRPAYFAEYPWQAHIRIAEYQCGGVLVSRHYIATAAHCIQQARIKDIVVFLGELDTQNSGYTLEPLAPEKHRVSKKIIHPKFQFRITQPDRYDLALLQLTTPTTYKNHILPICLPTSSIDLTGKKGIIAGWGKTKANMGHTGTNILQSASVPILSTFECIYWHESKQISVELFDEMLCAGHSDGHQDACLGNVSRKVFMFEVVDGVAKVNATPSIIISLWRTHEIKFSEFFGGRYDCCNGNFDIRQMELHYTQKQIYDC